MSDNRLNADPALHPWMNETPLSCLTVYSCFWCDVKHRADDHAFWEKHKRVHPDKFPEVLGIRIADSEGEKYYQVTDPGSVGVIHDLKLPE